MEVDHAAWLERNAPSASELDQLRRDSDALGYRPVFTVIVLASARRAPALEGTRRSLSAQIYPHHEFRTAEGWDGVSHIIIGSQGEFTVILKAGDIMVPEALACLATALHDPAHADIVYCDHDKISPEGVRHTPFFKPRWSPDLLLSLDYIGRACAIRTSLLRELGVLRGGYDLRLRASERTARILHVPRLLLGLDDRTAEPEPHQSVVQEALTRRAIPAEVSTVSGGGCRVRYRLTGDPKVSIIIPAGDDPGHLRTCLESIRRYTKTPRYEILIVGRGAISVVDVPHEVLPFDGPFHFPKMSNLAVRKSSGDFLLFLAHDTEIRGEGWLDELVSQAQQKNAGAVGPRLVDADGRIRQQGWIFCQEGAFEAFRGFPDGQSLYFNISNLTRDCTGVSGACLLISRAEFERVGGFDENFQRAYSDDDLCLMLRRRGRLVVCNPHVRVIQHEALVPDAENSLEDYVRLWTKWQHRRPPCDDYFNPNLTVWRTEFVPRAAVS